MVSWHSILEGKMLKSEENKNFKCVENDRWAEGYGEENSPIAEDIWDDPLWCCFFTEV